MKFAGIVLAVLLAALSFAYSSVDYSKQPPRSGVDSAGYEADSAGIIASQNHPTSDSAYLLTIQVLHACSGANIEAWVGLADGGPAEGAAVGIYALKSPRTLLAESKTNTGGMVSFGPRQAGRYELAASALGYADKTLAFDVADCTLPQSSGVVESPARQKPALLASIVQEYSSGKARMFGVYSVVQPGGRKKTYTEITVSYLPSKQAASATLVETIPEKVWSDYRGVGFVSAYPASISNSTPITMEWNLGKISALAPVSVTYRVEREITDAMADAFPEPQIVVAGENYTSEKQPGKGQEAASGAALFSIPELPSWAGTVAVGIALAGIAIFALLKGLAKPSS